MTRLDVRKYFNFNAVQTALLPPPEVVRSDVLPPGADRCGCQCDVPPPEVGRSGRVTDVSPPGTGRSRLSADVSPPATDRFVERRRFRSPMSSSDRDVRS